MKHFATQVNVMPQVCQCPSKTDWIEAAAKERPTIGSTYTKNGFLFRVDFIENGQVYVMRWPEGAKEGDFGSGRRVSLGVWESEMKGAAALQAYLTEKGV